MNISKGFLKIGKQIHITEHSFSESTHYRHSDTHTHSCTQTSLSNSQSLGQGIQMTFSESTATPQVS